MLSTRQSLQGGGGGGGALDIIKVLLLSNIHVYSYHCVVKHQRSLCGRGLGVADFLFSMNYLLVHLLQGMPPTVLEFQVFPAQGEKSACFATAGLHMQRCIRNITWSCSCFLGGILLQQSQQNPEGEGTVVRLLWRKPSIAGSQVM